MLQRMKISELSPGMVLGEDVYGKDALVLVSRGKSLDEKTISIMKTRLGKEEEVVLYIPYKEILTDPSSILISKETHRKMTIESISLEEVQRMIQSVMKDKTDYQKTKELIEELKSNISEAFDFLIANNEIKEEKFLDISNQILNQVDVSQNLINPGYLYMLELEKWHPDTFNHSIDVGFFTLSIASQFSNDHDELRSLFLGGLFHDIGKYIRSKEGDERFYQIITKNGPLTEAEFQILKKHVDVAGFFEDKFRFLTKKERENIIFAAIDHHEKMDGSGYLLGKKGMQISLAGRIVAVADIYDALIRKREYKSMMKPDQAMHHILELGQNGKLDKTYTSILRNVLGLYPTGSVLSTNKGFAIVVGQTDDPYLPKIVFMENYDGGEIDLKKSKDIEIYEEVE